MPIKRTQKYGENRIRISQAASMRPQSFDHGKNKLPKI